MRLLLPQEDPNPGARAARLAETASAYRYNRDHFGVLFANAVPEGAGYDARYVGAVVAQKVELLANRAAQRTAGWAAPDPGLLAALAALAPARAVEAIERHLSAAAGRYPDARPTSLPGYEALFSTAPRPLSLGRQDDDAFFAWQQVAGATPITIRGIDRVPENLAIDAAAFGRALGSADRLDQALAEGRLFLSDYALFDGVATGQLGGMKKYLWAPLALFVRLRSGDLRPVAIQVGQRPGPDNPIWTPADGVAWRMAKTTVQTAEMNMNGVVAHFGMCHAVAEALVCVSRRALSEAHPLLHLLRPHFEYTLAVNETARTSLVSRGGTQEQLQSGTLEANFAVLGRALSAQRFDAIGARADFAARGVADAERLPCYPFRDDGAPIADAIGRWVERYLRVYYGSDAQVGADPEVRAWAAELAGAGGFGAMPPLDSIEALARFTADMLWRLTGFHAVINYAGWDYAAYAPGMPSAAFGPGPRTGAGEADWFAMLPPLSVANPLLELMHTLAGLRLNRLGDYPAGHFDDPRVLPALELFGKELEAVAADTAARDRQRPWRFPFLYPDRVPASIHVL